ncbi:hypothetical protein B0T24DRAFT_391932 [Lasiosphaeria ovina]|uniref:Secreted protein n=1 Tax=Lasiosphaeria ovina TaxID=92902 RepID=A0AAE0MZP0_9PEZI|nr:hypothetical protein B0T24DRAFT_391932 [Lasiosphaeria ovina]
MAAGESAVLALLGQLWSWNRTTATPHDPQPRPTTTAGAGSAVRPTTFIGNGPFSGVFPSWEVPGLAVCGGLSSSTRPLSARSQKKHRPSAN